jgi:hypothetical protein
VPEDGSYPDNDEVCEGGVVCVLFHVKERNKEYSQLNR